MITLNASKEVLFENYIHESEGLSDCMNLERYHSNNTPCLDDCEINSGITMKTQKYPPNCTTLPSPLFACCFGCVSSRKLASRFLFSRYCVNEQLSPIIPSLFLPSSVSFWLIFVILEARVIQGTSSPHLSTANRLNFSCHQCITFHYNTSRRIMPSLKLTFFIFQLLPFSCVCGQFHSTCYPTMLFICVP